MKTIIIPLLILVQNYAISQPQLDTLTLPSPFTVVIVDSVPGTENLYSKSLLFFADNYANAEAVIELKDEKGQFIVGQSFFDIYMHPLGDIRKKQIKYGYVNYKIKIECKGDKYRITFFSMDHHSDSHSSVMPGGSLDNVYTKKKMMEPHPDVWRRIKGTTLLSCNEMARIYKAYISKPTSNF